jgi:hypothetical protein
MYLFDMILGRNQINSLNSIHQLVLVGEMQSVFCEVRTEFLNVVQVNLRLQRVKPVQVLFMLAVVKYI